MLLAGRGPVGGQAGVFSSLQPGPAVGALRSGKELLDPLCFPRLAHVGVVAVNENCHDCHVEDKTAGYGEGPLPRDIEKPVKERGKGKRKQDQDEDLPGARVVDHEYPAEDELWQEDEHRLWIEVPEVESGPGVGGFPLRLVTGEYEHEDQEHDQVCNHVCGQFVL